MRNESESVIVRWEMTDWKTGEVQVLGGGANWQYWKAIAGAEADTSSATLYISPPRHRHRH